jgi:nitrate/nitrite-specific signal transduction histidine kinase
MKPKTFMLSVLLIIFSMPTCAQINSLSQAINESGRLRMLSQRIAKAYILSQLDIQPDKAQQQFEQSSLLFKSNILQLKQFNSSINQPTINSYIENIEQIWRSYSGAFNQPFDGQALSNILMLSDATMLASEDLVIQFQAVSNTNSAHLVSIAGRQRMLSQRIAKLYSAMSLSDHDPQLSSELLEAISEFDTALNQLIQSKRNTHFISYKLKQVSAQWNFSKQGFKSQHNGNSTPLVIAVTTESILQQMDDITGLYEEIDQSSKAAL